VSSIVKYEEAVFALALSRKVILHTKLCELLNIRYPIVQAGIGGHTTPDLVVALSNA
jgi:hypothetical protein